MMNRSRPPSAEHPLGVAVCGTPITPGLAVWTNEFRVGVVTGVDEAKVRAPGFDGWFDVLYADGRKVMQNADRVSTVVEKRVKAADEWLAQQPPPFVCAECGTRTASTYVVTFTGEQSDPEGRTEVCRTCDQRREARRRLERVRRRYEEPAARHEMPGTPVGRRVALAAFLGMPAETPVEELLRKVHELDNDRATATRTGVFDERPTATCGCGFGLVWVEGEWQHDAAPALWGDDHDAPSANEEPPNPEARAHWDAEDGITTTTTTEEN